MANFDSPGSQNLTDTTELIQYLNSVTDFWFGPIILIAIFVIAFISLVGKTVKKSAPFAAASFITAIIAILFRAMGIVNDSWLIGSIVLAVAGLAAVYFEK